MTHPENSILCVQGGLIPPIQAVTESFTWMPDYKINRKGLLHCACTVGLCGVWCVGWVGGIFGVSVPWVATLAWELPSYNSFRLRLQFWFLELEHLFLSDVIAFALVFKLLRCVALISCQMSLAIRCGFLDVYLVQLISWCVFDVFSISSFQSFSGSF